jgi:ABC-type polysaccharide/polyol phosphate transport system ATPase subunit
LSVPTTRYDDVMILGHVFGTGDTTLVTRKTSAATREVRYKLSCLLIVGSNNTVIGSCDECLAVRSVLARNESCRWFVSFVKDFARSCVKVLHITLRIDCD